MLARRSNEEKRCHLGATICINKPLASVFKPGRTLARTRVFVEEMGSSAAQRRRRQWTLALVTAAALLERADEALLPAVYKEVGEALRVTPTALGSLTLCRALVQAVCYPLATCAAARYDRARVVAAGAFLWAVATLLVGASGTFLQVSDCHELFCVVSPPTGHWHSKHGFCLWL